MRALTLTQPWASLIAIGAKTIETRGWNTSYRGLIAIHAAKSFPDWAREACWEEPFRTVLTRAELVDFRGFSDLTDTSEERFAGLPRSAIVAVARIVNVVPTPQLRPGLHDEAFGDFAEGRFGFVLEDVRGLATPIPCRGALSLWPVPEDVLAQFPSELRGASR